MDYVTTCEAIEVYNRFEEKYHNDELEDFMQSHGVSEREQQDALKYLAWMEHVDKEIEGYR